MKRNPTFSIVTVNYNSGDKLKKTLQSISDQDYPFVEQIVIDGGSTDNALEVIQEFQEDIQYWVSEPDNGLYDAMNKALEKAQGDYVWFINSGDTLYSSLTISQIVSTLLNESQLPDILYGETALVDQDYNFKVMRRLKAPEYLSWKSFRRGMLVCHQAFIVRTDLAPKYNLKYRYSADFDWCIRCMKRSKTIRNTHLILVNYLDEGLTTQNRSKSLRERFRIMCRYYGVTRTLVNHLWFLVRFVKAKLQGYE